MKAGSLRSRLVGALAAGQRTQFVQAGRGRPLARPGQASKATMPVATAFRTGTAVATQMTTRRRRARKSPEYKAKPKTLKNRIVSTILRSQIKTIPQIFQEMNELDAGSGAASLNNITGATGVVPLYAYCLTTVDRPNTDNGDHFPKFVMYRDSSFGKGSAPVVHGNTSDAPSGAMSGLSRAFLSSIKIRMLLWGRTHKETTYQIQVIRFKKSLYHLNPYVAPDENLSLSTLTAEQLSERKAFWIDYMLRKHTVNPVAISQNLGSRFSKYVEVVYNKSVTIDEQESSFDEQNNEMVTISLPVNRVIQFNHDVDTRYDINTDADRTDSVINTISNDLQDVKRYHKAAVNHNLWLIVRANNTTTTGVGGEDTTEGHGLPPWVPSFDLSFQTNYKLIDAN